MCRVPLKIEKRLGSRKEQNSSRVLSSENYGIDFSSNDYLGFASSKEIFCLTGKILSQYNLERNGATGSRLLSGNHKLYDLTEKFIAEFHQSQAALIFNSGYDANVGFFSAIPGRGDLILYDELVHASIRDGISMNHAKAYKYKHNDLEDLNRLILQHRANPAADVYIVTESVFSMDGDSPNLLFLAALAEENGCFLVVDEAHSVGVHGTKGEGLVQELKLEEKIFARIITFGKALGAHGAAILGTRILKNYLVNFSRSFIFTTALPPHSVATIWAAYQHLEKLGSSTGMIRKSSDLEKLQRNMEFMKEQIKKKELQEDFICSDSAIHCCVISGNDRVKMISSKLRSKGFDVKPVLSPTVPVGKERLRVCIHSYNSGEEISQLVKLLGTFVK